MKLGKALIKGLKEAGEWHEKRKPHLWYSPKYDEIVLYPWDNSLSLGYCEEFDSTEIRIRKLFLFFNEWVADQMGYVKIGVL